MAYDKRYKRRHAARRFGRLRLKRGSAAFPESGGILMYQQEYERWLAAELEDKDLKPELLSIQGIDAEIQDRFAVELEFGTAGLRGVLGAGTNRMNIYMVRKATQGLANYLNKQGGKKSVAISYDSRIKSDVFAREAARVLAGNGVKAYLYKEMMPVPALSFATRHLHCDAGIMVTASHNPAKYNGYKAYGPDGCQMTSEAADAVYAEMQATDIFAGIRLADFDAALEQGGIEYIGQDTIEALYENIKAQSVRPGLCKTAGLKLVYSPLNGSGLVPVTRVLGDIGITDITIVPEQQYPDGNFPTCPYPNPEIREALALGLALAEKSGADLMLATDPDADRVGIAVRCKDGSYQLLSGNEVGVLLLDYICKGRTENGTMPKAPVCVKSIVSTPLADVVAAHYGVECRNVLTGFKWIGDQIAGLEAAGEVAVSYTHLAVGTYGTAINGMEDDNMKFLKVTSGKCEVFTAPDVNAVEKSYNGGKLTEGVCYPVQAEVGSSGGYSWVRIFVAGVQRYAAVLADRCQLVTLSPGDAFTACVAQGGDTAELEKQLEVANARADEANKRLANIKAYVAGV